MTPYTLDQACDDWVTAAWWGDWDLAASIAARVDRLDTHPTVPPMAAALWYAEQGHPVFPVQAGGKVPYPRTRGFKDASTSAAQVRAWWGEWPDANVGLATGFHFDVIDFDGIEGHKAWGEAFGHTWGGVERLAVVSTPRPGGLHVYCPPMNERNGAGLLPGVDYRGTGGYVLAPPSVLDDRAGQHPGTYRFLRPLVVGA